MKTFSYICASLLGITFLFQQFVFRTEPDRLAEAAQAFLNTLNSQQQEKVTFSFEDKERLNWNFVPVARQGLPIKEMNEQQRKAAHALMHASLSQQGYQKATNVMELENILRVVEKRGPDDTYRDPLNYYFSIFGDPQQDKIWGWRLEGHHLSVNFSTLDNKIVSATPTFFGSNPGKVPSGPKKGWRVLQPEEDLARELVKSLNDEQLETALIAEEAYPEIITGNEQEVSMGEPEGVAFADMNAAQQQKLMQLIEVYYAIYHSEFAQQELEQIKARQDNLHFAWAGGLNMGDPHYYRIHGAELLIEYDNTQNNANHIHTVIRNLKNDFGRNVLKAHYEEAHKE